MIKGTRTKVQRANYRYCSRCAKTAGKVVCYNLLRSASETCLKYVADPMNVVKLLHAIHLLLPYSLEALNKRHNLIASV